jgi:hypothetical protein
MPPLCQEEAVLPTSIRSGQQPLGQGQLVGLSTLPGNE